MKTPPNTETLAMLQASATILSGLLMTRIELDAEWNYRYEERLGILCGESKPTPEQRRMASEEADRAIKGLCKQP